MKDRVILHCDCNNFFASVELLEYPELQDKPVAVSGSVDERHGIILAKNEVAKKYDVKTAETVIDARKKCPGLILLQPHRKKYSKYSKIINEIYAQYTDQIEAFGIDESWLDITGSWQLFGPDPISIAHRIREEVYAKTKLTISVGVSFNKVFAKLGSDIKKPNAVTAILSDDYKNIVWPLPVSTMLFVGAGAAKALQELGIHTIGELALADDHLIENILGKSGINMLTAARGLDNSPVAKYGEREPIKSVGRHNTYSCDIVGFDVIYSEISDLCDDIAQKLRKESLYANGIQILIKSPELKTISRQRALNYSTDIGKELADEAMKLVNENWNDVKPVRMLGVTAIQLSDVPAGEQINLLENEKKSFEKRKYIERSMDLIRAKFGNDSIMDANRLHKKSRQNKEDDG